MHYSLSNNGHRAQCPKQIHTVMGRLSIARNAVINERFDRELILVTNTFTSAFPRYYRVDEAGSRERVYPSEGEDVSNFVAVPCTVIQFAENIGFDANTGRPLFGEDLKQATIETEAMIDKPIYETSQRGLVAKAEFAIVEIEEDRPAAGLKKGDKIPAIFRVKFTIDNEEIRNRTLNYRF